jgi:5-methylcytosine-specific restriction endonuclease McrA
MAKTKVKKPRKKKTYNLKSRITSALRKIWLYHPERTAVKKRCETADHFLKIAKSGKEYKAPYYKCEKCKKKSKYIEIDHLEPVTGFNGFQDWNTFVNRLFVTTDKMIGLCSSCHDAKTLVQREIRKKMKEALK